MQRRQAKNYFSEPDTEHENKLPKHQKKRLLLEEVTIDSFYDRFVSRILQTGLRAIVRKLQNAKYDNEMVETLLYFLDLSYLHIRQCNDFLPMTEVGNAARKYITDFMTWQL